MSNEPVEAAVLRRQSPPIITNLQSSIYNLFDISFKPSCNKIIHMIEIYIFTFLSHLHLAGEDILTLLVGTIPELQRFI
jgi:hypothetical protein